MSQENSTSVARPSMFPVLLAALIDMIGIGIVIPVIAPLIINNETGIVPDSIEPATRSLIYGVLAALYPLAQFFGAPVLGAISDRFGRKPILMIALFGSMLGYVVFAFGIIYNSLWLAFAGRLIDGFTGGNIAIVYSAVADLSDPKLKARNFGLIGMMFGIGLVIGPALGGILADSDLVSWFNPALPFWVAGGLCGFNVLVVWLNFKETLREKTIRPINPLTGFRNIGRAFAMTNLRWLFIVVFLMTLGFAFFTSFFNVYMIGKFDFAEKDLGFMFGFIGICIAFIQGVVMRPVSERFRPHQVPTVTLAILGGVLLLTLLPQEVFWVYILIPFVALGQGLSAPNINALVSESASENQQGEIMGINMSMAALGNAVPPFLAGLLGTVDYAFPTIAAGGFVLLAWLVFVFVFRRRNPQPAN